MQNVLPFAHEDAINTIINENNHFGDAMAMQIGNVVRSGNVGLARDLITLINKRGGYGFNFLHE